MTAPVRGATRPARTLRQVLGTYATGVTAVLGVDPGTGRPAGLVANSFTSVSLDPPLVSVCVARTSTSWPRVRAAGRLSINVLAAGQRQACTQLARPGADKLGGLPLGVTPAGTPVLCGALAWLDCAIGQEIPAGDHTLVILRVHDRALLADGEPLVFFGGEYGGFRRP